MTDHAPLPEWITVPQAAKHLGVSVSYLNKLRCKGGGPMFSKFGAAVRYSRAGLDAWAARRQYPHTSAYDDDDDD